MEKKIDISKFGSKILRKNYLKDILTASFSEKATATKSLSEKLVAKAKTYGLSQQEAEQDVKGIMNINKAIDTILEKVVDEEWATIPSNTPNINIK